MVTWKESWPWPASAPILLVLAYLVLISAHPKVQAPQLAVLTLLSVAGSFMLLVAVACLCLAACLLWKIARHDTAEPASALVRRLFLQRWEEDRASSLIAPLLIFALLMPSFNAFKQSVLPLAGFGTDAQLAALDRALFLGSDPWTVTHAFFGTPEASMAISLFYHELFLPVGLGIFLCAVLPLRPAFRTQYLLSYILVWILIRSVLAFLLPSAGPAFWSQFHGDPDPFRPLMERLAGQERLLLASGQSDGLSALRLQQVLSSDFAAEQLALGRGISAMPSVHNALAVQFACAGFAIHRRLGWACSLSAVLIWAGSIHLGWHYAVDGIVAAAITIPLWFACGRWANLLHANSCTAWARPMPPKTRTI